MNKAYETMRGFWLNVHNLKHREEVPQLGPQKICVAGVEMAAADEKGVLKHILIAASSLGNASMYFENNSPSGIGGFTGGAASGPVREKALHLLQTAAKTAEKLPVTQQLPLLQDPAQVTLFALSGDGNLRAVTLPEAEARKPENEWYGFFAYSQQLLGAFRSVQEQAEKPANPSEKSAQATDTPRETKA